MPCVSRAKDEPFAPVWGLPLAEAPCMLFVRALDRTERIKAALLSSWFFVTVAALWLLKSVRGASLLAHLGARETPYVRLAGVAGVAVTVMFYSVAVKRLSRVNIVR